MSIIEIVNLDKTFKVLNKSEGIRGAIKDLFSNDYKYIKAVDGISMNIGVGEIVGYIGPNGAGKSTTIKMMTGVLEPTSGKILINGNDPFKKRIINAQNIGVVFGQRTQLWWALPLIESFKMLKAIYKIDDETYNSNLKLFDDLVDISSLYLKPVRQMSLGQKTLCDILAAFLHDPKVIFLDEPTIGLDVSIKSKIRNLIKELNTRKKTTVILTTHDIGDIEALCHRAIIIDKGKIIFDDKYEKLKYIFGSYRTLKINIDNLRENIITELKNFNKSLSMSFDDSKWLNVVIDEEKISTAEVLNYIMTNYKVSDIKIDEINAEDIIRRIYDQK